MSALPAVVSALRDTAASAHRYPSFRPDGLRATIAEHTGVEAAHISVGAGATAVLSAILQDSAARARARGRTGPRIVTPAPTFEGFALLAEMIGLGIDTTPLFDDGRPDVGALAAAAGETAALFTCYGIGVATRALGGEVTRAYPEDTGPTAIILTDDGRRDRLFGALATTHIPVAKRAALQRSLVR